MGKTSFSDKVNKALFPRRFLSAVFGSEYRNKKVGVAVGAF
jgi:hypothetical protein